MLFSLRVKKSARVLIPAQQQQPFSSRKEAASLFDCSIELRWAAYMAK